MGEQHEDRFLTRREAELLIDGTACHHDEQFEAHRREHVQESEAVEKALNADRLQQQAHNIAHDRAHVAHEEKHGAEEQAIKVALASVSRERIIHAEAHQREHEGHLRVHELNNLAIEKAEAASDKRFSSANAFKEQFGSALNQLASRESLESLTKEVDRRLSALERTDHRAEGKGIGRGATIAYIVTAITVIATILGAVVVVATL